MTKSHIDDLALLGGSPLFCKPRPIGQLFTPPVEDYLALIRKVIDARRVTNDGPMVQKLEQRLAGLHGTRHCIAVANAGIGIMMLLQVLSEGRRGEVIMPAFTYPGLPHFAQWAGQVPLFCDVDPRTHTLDPSAVEAAISENTTSILGVCSFNNPGALDRLDKIAEHHQLPLIIDAVDGLACTFRGQPLGAFGRAQVFSLHATKLLNGFEGGYITTNDAELADVLRSQRNFSLEFDPDRECSHIIGLNAKLNEFHAAMAHLSLDHLDEIISGNKARFDAYRETCTSMPGWNLLAYPDPDIERSNYQMIVFEVSEPWMLTRDQTLALLRAEGVSAIAHQSPALHHSSHCPAGLVPPDLPVTERLAQSLIRMPAGALVSLEDIQMISGLLRFIQGHKDVIAARLTEAGGMP